MTAAAQLSAPPPDALDDATALRVLDLHHAGHTPREIAGITDTALGMVLLLLWQTQADEAGTPPPSAAQTDLCRLLDQLESAAALVDELVAAGATLDAIDASATLDVTIAGTRARLTPRT